MPKTKLLVTGMAGFIGFHLARFLAASDDFEILGIDSLNSSYDPRLKTARLFDLGFSLDRLDCGEGEEITSRTNPNLRFLKLDLQNHERLLELGEKESFNIIVHLAGQSGVRNSCADPHSYVKENILGFLNIVELARTLSARTLRKTLSLKHLLYASSSSVYGTPVESAVAARGLNESEPATTPASLYAATKRSDELIAYSYSHLYQIPITAMRFFSVYGPWGRPDMAYFDFTRKILMGETIELYNFGNMIRDFTYIDDVIECIKRLIPLAPKPVNTEPEGLHSVMNIGRCQPVRIGTLVETLEKVFERQACTRLLPPRPEEIPETCADLTRLYKKIRYQPQTTLETGIRQFAMWYRRYYGDSIL